MIGRLQSVRKRSIEKQIPFDLDKKWMSEKLNIKNCEVSNILCDHDKGVWYTQSIDRTDNNGGYTKDNCKMVIWGLNVGKGQNCSYEEIYKIAKGFIEQYDRKNI